MGGTFNSIVEIPLALPEGRPLDPRELFQFYCRDTGPTIWVKGNAGLRSFQFYCRDTQLGDGSRIVTGPVVPFNSIVEIPPPIID